MPPLLLLSDYGGIRMTETTEKTQLPEAEKTPIQAADIAIIVESAAKEKTPRLAPVIEVKPLVAKEYVDPQSQDYLVEKNNQLNMPMLRDTEEGRQSIHHVIHLMGDQAEY